MEYKLEGLIHFQFVIHHGQEEIYMEYREMDVWKDEEDIRIPLVLDEVQPKETDTEEVKEAKKELVRYLYTKFEDELDPDFVGVIYISNMATVMSQGCVYLTPDGLTIQGYDWDTVIPESAIFELVHHGTPFRNEVVSIELAE